MADPDETRLSVLVVDDHRMFAESLGRLLAEDGDITVVGIAVDGSEALDLVACLQPRVVLLDYEMPGQDGIATAAEIKRQYPHIMVIMITGSTDDRVLVAAIEVGCSGFLTKDQAATEVADAVRAAAAGEALISPSQLIRLLPKLNRTPRDVHVELTEREREILIFLVRGLSNKVIASELFLSVNTVRNYVQSVLTKLGVHSKLEAVSTAVREGIIEYPRAA